MKSKKKTNTPNGQLRFAALIRVSTEKQEKQGESLNTQKKQLIEYAKRLNGRIICWYGGAEHGVEGYERREVDRLLKDVQKSSTLFNAVIVCDPDRWSRDNVKSKQGLRTLRDNGIRYFTGCNEWDLFRPEHILYLGMSAEFGEFQALSQKRKSLDNRIERAKQNRNASGSLPFGRIYDKVTMEWGIDEEKKAMIVDVANRYITGESMKDLAAEYGMNISVLHQILNKRCGDVWIQSYNSNNLNIHETVETKIPRLLSDETIEAIRKRAQANKTFSHGPLKNKYLLNRMCFCEHCGCVVSPHTTVDGKYFYYRHLGQENMKRQCSRPEKCNNVNGRKLEAMVMHYLYEMFGDPMTVQKAIEDATPDKEKIERDRLRLGRIEKSLKNITRSRNRVIRLVIAEKITEEQAGVELDKLKYREAKLTEEKSILTESLEHIPNTDEIKQFAKQFKRHSLAVGTAKRRSKSVAWFDHITYKDKRALIETIFNGKTPDGKRMGVYIEWKSPKRWHFHIRGHLIEANNLRCLSETRRKRRLDDELREIGTKQDQFLSTLARHCPPTSQRRVNTRPLAF